MSVYREIRLVEEGDGRWAATDEAAGVTVRADSRSDALSELDGVLAERRARDDATPLGSRLRGMADDIDPDAVEDVRDVREHV
ncbi:type II toxin-antitoxin system HicB family antitoxin [Salarchaeum japonicum]|uniref:type II toxin-antitoxin system HicB family antitoxin n=1 Tax=Salarchaeum japonicum TaxID=555573 RepID=UPI003C725A42